MGRMSCNAGRRAFQLGGFAINTHLTRLALVIMAFTAAFDQVFFGEAFQIGNMIFSNCTQCPFEYGHEQHDNCQSSNVTDTNEC